MKTLPCSYFFFLHTNKIDKKHYFVLCGSTKIKLSSEIFHITRTKDGSAPLLLFARSLQGPEATATRLGS